MPRRDDLHKILILGSGPIVIGQAAEFDYSGVQACKVLREEGYEVVLVNSNPATIMTDPEFADATYVEPLLPGPGRADHREGAPRRAAADARRPDGAEPRQGARRGRHARALRRRADRRRLRGDRPRRGPRPLPRDDGRGRPADAQERDRDDARRGARRTLDEIGLPAIMRPGVHARRPRRRHRPRRGAVREIVARGLDASPIGQVLIDQSVIGWGEFELEVMRDRNDNCVIVCSIENIDPMGVHTGDSVTVAPQQTLPDRLYQQLRDQAMTVIRAVGVETGGSNVQFAVNPETDEILVIEMNPRVSRSSALASKATGFPIAKIAARLAVGYTLEEIPNDITQRHAGELRADDRLRRRQVAAVRVREVPRRRPGPLDAHEERGRGRWRSAARSSRRSPRRCAAASSTSTPDVAGLVAEELLDDARAARPPTATTHMLEAFRRGASRRGRLRALRRRPLVPARAARARARPAGAVRRRALVQGGRHLRRRVRGARRRTSTPAGSASRDDEVERLRAAQAVGRDPRRRARTASARASSSTTAACTPR